MTDDETQRMPLVDSEMLHDDRFMERMRWIVLTLFAFVVMAIGFLLAALVLWSFRRAMGET